jgi:hypothetical protein
MLDAKMVADFITATRGLLGLIIVWLGITQGETALPMVVFLMLLDWTGDFVDGGIAQRSRHPRRTRIGDSDIYIDLFVSLCLAIYLLSAGLAGFAVGFWYMLGWALVLWRFGLDKNLLMLLQAPIYLWFILTAVRLIPELGNWLVVWVLVALAINWRRFSREIVPKFIDGMRSMWRDHHA